MKVKYKTFFINYLPIKFQIKKEKVILKFHILLNSIICKKLFKIKFELIKLK